MSKRFPQGGGGGHGDDDTDDGWPLIAERSHYETQKRGECFLCTWANRFDEGANTKKVKKLFDILYHYGMCDNREQALQLHLYFKEHVYKPDQGMSMLTKEIALGHIESLSTSSSFMNRIK
jgi:hypothetical protein